MSRTVMLGIAMLLAAAVGTGGMLWLNGIRPEVRRSTPPDRPQRIVAFGPNVVECLFAMGAGDRLVGRDSWARFPPEARSLPDVGSLQTANLEIIRSLKPDVIFIQFKTPGVREFAEAAGIGLFNVKMDSLATIHDGIAQIGEVVDSPVAARMLNERIDAELDQVRRLVAGRPRPTVMVVIGRKRGALADILVAGRSYLGELVEVAGGENLFADNERSYVPVPLEEVRRRRPDIIIELRTDVLDAAQRKSLRGEWAELGDAHVVGSEAAFKPGPRIGQTARLLAELIHPEAFEQE